MSNPETAITQYTGWNEDDAAADLLEAKKKNSDWFTFPVGDTRIRLLPSPYPGCKPIQVVHQHNFKMPGQKNNVIFNCAEMMAQRPCPGCELYRSMKKSPNKEVREAAYDFAPKFRAIGYAAIRKVEKGAIVDTFGPKKVGIGKKLFEKLAILRRNPDYGDITDPGPSGVDLTITRTGTTQNDTSYELIAARKSSSLGDNSFIDRCEDLRDDASVLTYDEIREKMAGKKEDRDGGGGGERRREEAVTPPAGRSVQDDLDNDKATANAGGAVEDDSDIPF